MPYFTDGNRSPCYYHQKKSLFNGPCHIIPITKRPIEKVTTRSQAQFQQQLIKQMGLDGTQTDRNNNASNFVAERVGAINSGLLSTTSTTSSTSTASKRSESRKQQATTATAASGSAAKSNNKPLNKPPNKPVGKAASKAAIIAAAAAAANAAPCRSLPVAPSKVLDNHEYSSHLTTHEKKEIWDYARIYFIGKIGIKKRTPHTATVYTIDGHDTKIYGFDDNNGSYVPVIHDHIAYRYEILKVIGKGTFGVVLQAYDHKCQKSVALKVIRNQPRFHTQAKEEIKILTKLLENDTSDSFNVVHMYDHFMFRNHPCIVFELLSLNLFELSKKNSFMGFTLSLIKRFTYSIVKCLYALNQYDIIHCDLKPENILLKQQNRSGIKVIDFGSSCFSNKRVHSYIQSRYYRSPEVILGAKYGPSIDMWSLGCILAELYIGRPLLDGENEGDQLACMMELLNVPPQGFLNKCKSTKVRQFIDSAGNPIYSARYYHGQHVAESGKSPRGKIRGPPGSRLFLPMCKMQEFKDFVAQCLVWDPAERMTPAMALKHPWLKRTETSPFSQFKNVLVDQDDEDEYIRH